MTASGGPDGMDVTADELAGVVDLFGGLTREELADGLAELAYKQGREHDPAAFTDDIQAALDSYHLVSLPADEVTADAESPVLVAGPTAFPALPEDARDLLHILDVPERSVDRERKARKAAERFRAEAAQALDDGDDDRIRELIDVSYELETWGAVDLAAVRDRME
jgi:hypothetical protein